MRKVQSKTAEITEYAEFCLIRLGALCVLRGYHRITSYDFFTVAFTACALTVERGMAIGWVCAAASLGTTLRNLADLFAQSFRIASACELLVKAK